MKFNQWGIPRPETDEEQQRLTRALLMHRCPACRAKAGEPCKKTKDGAVHMGRLPDGFDTALAMAGEYEPRG